MPWKATAHVALAIGVILAWLTALLWMVISVAQIGVEHTVVRSCVVVEPREALRC